MPTILIAEDDLLMRRGIAMTLARDRFEVVETDGGESVPELVAETRPDVVVLDICLNGADGFKICRRLRKSGFRREVFRILPRCRRYVQR